MNEDRLDRALNSKPSDSFELIFWYIDKINSLRAHFWPPHYLEPYVREMAVPVEQLYTEWLMSKGFQKNDQDLSQYLYLVLPYISFRILNARGTKPVSIFKATANQKKRLIDCMIEELHELPDTPLLRAMMRESLKTLLEFLESLRCQREQ
jgi:hypothetical protein